MKTIFAPACFKEKPKGVVIVIGVFDGLHRGHRYLINKAVAYAKRIRRKSLCLTFHPHPQNVPYLVSLKHRLRLIAELGLDYCLVVPFNKKFAVISPEDFIGNILVKKLKPHSIFIGAGFHFGYKAEGDVALLKTYGKKTGFKVRAVKELKAGRRIISSNVIRSLIKQGDLKSAEKFLGRKVSVLGTVVPGAKRGRALGIPTANIDPHHEVLPKEGVYAVKIIFPAAEAPASAKTYNGLCNIGRRPTFTDGNDESSLEVHIFNFKKNIYGEDLEIQFVKRIRNEQKFPTEEDLISQINEDRKAARLILKS